MSETQIPTSSPTPLPKVKRRKKKSRKGLIIGLILAVVFIIIIAVVVSSNKEKALEVQVEPVQRRNITQTVTATGKIQSEIQVDISYSQW